MTNAYYSAHMPRDPYNRKIFQIICDHIRTTLDPEITEIRFKGIQSALHVDEPDEVVAAFQGKVISAFKANALCGDENRCWGTFESHDGFRWGWHFERRNRQDAKATKNEIGVVTLILST